MEDPLILDLETKGTAPFQFQPKHQDFQILFQGIKQGNHVCQNFGSWINQWPELAVGANIKFDLKGSKKTVEPIIPKYVRDVEVDCHLLRSDLVDKFKLETLAELFRYPWPNWKHFIDFEKTNYWEDIPLLKWYNKHDLCSTEWIDAKIQPLIKKHGLLSLQRLYSDFILTMVEMEGEGIQVDRSFHEEFTQENKFQLDFIREQLKDFADIDWQSPKQVAEYYVKQGIKLPKTGKEKDQVNEQALLKINHPSARVLLDYRATAKQYQTYGEGFQQTLIDWTYYPDYHLTRAKTGRLSEKFIQVMPRSSTSNFKKCIISKYSDGYILAVDWGQQELRINAEMAYYVTGKRNLLDDMLNNYDLHAETLARFPFLLNRTRAKNVNFSVFFGGKGWTLINLYGLTKEQAEVIRTDLLQKRYPEMLVYFDWCERQMLTKGYVTNPFTGKRRFTNSFTEGYNDPIQGMGTVFNKIMMIETWRLLESQGMRARPIAEIHDEIVFDVPGEELSCVQTYLREAYKAFPEYFYKYFKKELACRYDVEMKVGKNLLEAKKI